MWFCFIIYIGEEPAAHQFLEPASHRIKASKSSKINSRALHGPCLVASHWINTLKEPKIQSSHDNS